MLPRCLIWMWGHLSILGCLMRVVVMLPGTPLLANAWSSTPGRFWHSNDLIDTLVGIGMAWFKGLLTNIILMKGTNTLISKQYTTKPLKVLQRWLTQIWRAFCLANVIQFVKMSVGGGLDIAETANNVIGLLLLMWNAIEWKTTFEAQEDDLVASHTAAMSAGFLMGQRSYMHTWNKK